MIRKILSAMLIFISAITLICPSFSAAADEFTYTVYLNTAGAFRPDDKTIGGVNTINVRVEYDSEELELITDFSGSYRNIFPKFKANGTVVNNDEEGILYFNSLTLTPYIFDDDGNILAQLRFRYKHSSHPRAQVKCRLMELSTETQKGYDQLISKGQAHRNNIRLLAVRDPDSAKGLPLGDADGDGSVTINDAASIRRNLSKIPNGDYVPGASDVDGNGSVTILDATYIQRYTVSLSSPTGIGKPIT